MRAVDGEYLKLLSLDPPHPAWDVGRRPIPGSRVRVAVSRQPRLPRGEAIERAEADPRLMRPLAAKTREDKPDYRDAHQGRGHHVEHRANLEEESASGGPGADRLMSFACFNERRLRF